MIVKKHKKKVVEKPVSKRKSAKKKAIKKPTPEKDNLTPKQLKRLHWHWNITNFISRQLTLYKVKKTSGDEVVLEIFRSLRDSQRRKKDKL